MMEWVSLGPGPVVAWQQRSGGEAAALKHDHHVTLSFFCSKFCFVDFRCWEQFCAMPAQLHLDDGILLLPAGSSIKLHTASSDIDESICGLPKEFISRPGDDAISLTEMWLVAFLSALRVPDDCISFSWSRDGYMSYQVLVVFIPLSAERLYELTPGFSDNCIVCAVFYDDQPNRYWNKMHNLPDEKCIQCGAWAACDRCSVMTRRGCAKCYTCLTDEELVQAKEDYPTESLRLGLLATHCRRYEASAPTRGLDDEARFGANTRPLTMWPRRQREAIHDVTSAPTRGPGEI